MKRPAFLSHGPAAPTRVPSVPRIRSICSTSPNPVSKRPYSSASGKSHVVDMKLDVGTRVRVSRSIEMYHYPGRKNQLVDVQGFEGVIAQDKSLLDGVIITATAPYFVDFSEAHPKFKAHFEESELEVIEES